MICCNTQESGAPKIYRDKSHLRLQSANLTEKTTKPESFGCKARKKCFLLVYFK